MKITWQDERLVVDGEGDLILTLRDGPAMTFSRPGGPPLVIQFWWINRIRASLKGRLEGTIKALRYIWIGKGYDEPKNDKLKVLFDVVERHPALAEEKKP